MFNVPRQDNGFTLLELFVTLAVFGVLAAITVPSFLQFQRRLELDSARNTLVSAVRLARSNAAESRVGANWVAYLYDDPAIQQAVIRVEPVTPVGPGFGEQIPPRRYELGRNIRIINRGFRNFNANAIGICPEPGACAVFDARGEAREPALPEDRGQFVLGNFEIGARGLPDTVNRCVRVSTILGAIRTSENEPGC